MVGPVETLRGWFSAECAFMGGKTAQTGRVLQSDAHRRTFTGTNLSVFAPDKLTQFKLNYFRLSRYEVSNKLETPQSDIHLYPLFC